MVERLIKELQARAAQFETEAHWILGTVETSTSRIIHLNDTYRKLSSLSLKQDELFRQSLRCLENGLFRAAHVMGWAGAADYLQEYAYEDGFATIKAERPKWKLSTKTDLREHVPEAQLIDVMYVVGLLQKGESKGFHGLLTRRNECAHPSDYYPDLNQSLGYISELIQRIQQIENRRAP